MPNLSVFTGSRIPGTSWRSGKQPAWTCRGRRAEFTAAACGVAGPSSLHSPLKLAWNLKRGTAIIVLPQDEFYSPVRCLELLGQDPLTHSDGPVEGAGDWGLFHNKVL